MSTLVLLLPFLAAAPADDPRGREILRPDLFQTLVNPNCSHCVDESKRKAGELRRDDRVLAWIRGKYDGGAIPHRWFLVPYRVVSDTYGVFVYDADADFVRGFPPSLDFRFEGWRDGVMVMRRVDGTLFDCLTGKALSGPGKDKKERLAPIPTIETDWGPWLDAGPGTVAYAMVAKFRPSEIPKTSSEHSKGSRPPADPRLDAEERVFGVELGDEAVALPLATFGPAPEVRTLDGGRTVVLWDPRTRTAAAYRPETEGESPRKVSLSVEASRPDAPWVDKETGSRWTIAGRAVSGPLKGATLAWTPGVMVKWFAWSASHPKTKIERAASSAKAE